MIVEHQLQTTNRGDAVASPRSGLLRGIAIVAATATLGLLAAACGSSTPSTTATTAKSTTTTAATSTTAAGTTMTTTPLTTADQAAITTTFSTIFNLGDQSAAGVAAKIALLQDGPALQAPLVQLATSPTAKVATGATVTSMGLLTPAECQSEALTSPCAEVKYGIVGGTTASPVSLLPGQTGFVLQQGGTWLLAKLSICGLIGIFDATASPAVPVPAVCSAG